MNKRTKIILIGCVIVIFLFIGYYLLSSNNHHMKGVYKGMYEVQHGYGIFIDDEQLFIINGFDFDFSKLELNKTYNFYYRSETEVMSGSGIGSITRNYLIEVRDTFGTQPNGFNLVNR